MDSDIIRYIGSDWNRDIMKIIISPAKKMKMDTDDLPCDGLPQFLPQSEQLLRQLQSLDYPQLKAIWGCSEALTKLNFERLKEMSLRRSLTPAILAYEGIQYQYMAPGVFETAQLDYIREHLRILSGFYGLLRAFDGVTPYRLEMQARLAGEGYRNLYEFWGDSIARQLCGETDCIVNLASQEYSRCISLFLPDGVRFLTCGFGELKNGRMIEKGMACKMARGEMVRFLAQNEIVDPSQIKRFDRLGYMYSDTYSSPDYFAFIKGGDRAC